MNCLECGVSSESSYHALRYCRVSFSKREISNCVILCFVVFLTLFYVLLAYDFVSCKGFVLCLYLPFCVMLKKKRWEITHDAYFLGLFYIIFLYWCVSLYYLKLLISKSWYDIVTFFCSFICSLLGFSSCLLLFFVVLFCFFKYSKENKT